MCPLTLSAEERRVNGYVGPSQAGGDRVLLVGRRLPVGLLVDRAGRDHTIPVTHDGNDLVDLVILPEVDELTPVRQTGGDQGALSGEALLRLAGREGQDAQDGDQGGFDFRFVLFLL